MLCQWNFPHHYNSRYFLFVDDYNAIIQNEMEAALNLGATPDRIIYAHPCKMRSHLTYAAEKGIKMMTFDTISELNKVKKFLPAAEYVIATAMGEIIIATAMGVEL